jgi:hypothetical protein
MFVTMQSHLCDGNADGRSSNCILFDKSLRGFNYIKFHYNNASRLGIESGNINIFRFI